jgi:hypothetical protein
MAHIVHMDGPYAARVDYRASLVLRGTELSASSARLHVTNRLALDAMPLNGNGKADRPRIQRLFQERAISAKAV